MSYSFHLTKFLLVVRRVSRWGWWCSSYSKVMDEVLVTDEEWRVLQGYKKAVNPSGVSGEWILWKDCSHVSCFGVPAGVAGACCADGH